MAALVVEITLDQAGQIKKRSVLPGRHGDGAKAQVFLEEKLSKYPSHGFDDQHGYWWARDEAGELHRFVINQMSPPEIHAASTKSVESVCQSSNAAPPGPLNTYTFNTMPLNSRQPQSVRTSVRDVPSSAGDLDPAPIPKQLVDFGDPKERMRWLIAQPYDVAAVFAARAALRVVPAMSLASVSGRSRATKRKIILRVFRAVGAAWTRAAYPSHRDALDDATRAALIGLGNLKAPSPERAAAYAAAAAVEDKGSFSRASTAVGYALDAAGSMGRDAFDITLKALEADADLLGQRFSPVTIANSQLWPSRVPDWVNENWDELKSALLASNEDWEVWTEWYDERLMGTLANGSSEITRATIAKEIWEQGPKPLNTHIKLAMLDRNIFQHATADETFDAPSVDFIPQQFSNGSQFALDAEGRLDLVPDPPSHAPLADKLQREMYEEVRHKAAALSSVGHNQLAELSDPIARFRSSLPDNISAASINRVWSRGNTLRRYLKAHEAVATSSEPSEPARLSPVVAEKLRDLIDTYNVFIIGDPKGRELDHVRLGPQERNEAQTILGASLPIVQAVKSSDGLATAAAIEILTEQTESATVAPIGIDGDQAIEQSRKTSSNFVAEVLRAAYVPIRVLIAEGKFGWKEIRAGGYRGVGAAAAMSYIPGLVTFVVDNAIALRAFVDQAFHSAELVRVIDLIVQAAGKMGPIL